MNFELPDEFFRFPALKVHSGLNVLVRGDHVITNFAALEALLRINIAKRSVDTLFVPAPGRRGVSATRLEPYAMDLFGVIRNASRLVLIEENSGGEVILVHYDSHDLPHHQYSTEIFVSVLSPDLKSACPDGRLMVESLRIPNPHFSADTLWIQTDGVEGERPWIRVSGYVINTDGCEWESIEPAASLTRQ